MSANMHHLGAGFTGAVRNVATIWALAGGVLLMAVVGVNMIAVIGGPLGWGFSGDFELTEMGVAIAAFSFLPYCQLTGANVTADVFTARASARTVAMLTFAGAIVALVFSVILVWRMYLGMVDQRTYEYTTAILRLPQWIAYVPILFSILLLSLGALVSLIEEGRKMSGENHV